MMMSLTEKQERFAQAYIETGNKSDAYRDAYNAENMNNNSIRVEAHRLFENPNITLRIFELQEEHAERHRVTVDSITDELNQAKDLAREERQASAMTAAIVAKSKLHGLMTDRKEISGPGGKPIETENDMTWRIEVISNETKDLLAELSGGK